MLSLIVLIVILAGGYFYLVKSNQGQKAFAKYIDKILANSPSSKKNNSLHKDMKALRGRLETMSDEVNRQSYTIQALQNENSRLNSKFDSNRKDTIAIKEELTSLRQSSLLQTSTHETSRKYDNQLDDRQKEIPSRLFTSGPTSRNPFGFRDEDCSEKDDGQIFIIERRTDSGGIVTINPNAINVSRFISNLKYYSNLIDYTISNSSNPTEIDVKDPGCVVKRGRVWEVIDKMKIEIKN